MIWRTDDPVRLEIDGVSLEAACWGPPPSDAPTLVLLHEGLGCLGLWRDFPSELSARTGWGVFAYSRRGYGQSDPTPSPRPLNFMTREALEVLPQVLNQVGAQNTLLLGHSDGASIAAIYAGETEDRRLCGLGLLAPHFFTEPVGLASIRAARQAFKHTDLPARMARHHQDATQTFYGWNDVWLHPDFATWNIENCLTKITVPVLALQGRDDQYGSLAQIDALSQNLPPATTLKQVILDDCRHAPQLEQPLRTLEEIVKFTVSLAL
ncbi:MAG: alpha/beta hydrolase [Alphaproteobacteria bacterium]|nr:alpha/beta hydrolase [Alphaproteobacteria bacterium]